jgi:segregation and condensation protein B
MELKAKIEAIIYAAEEPITMEQIALLVKDIVLARDSVTDSGAGEPAAAETTSAGAAEAGAPSESTAVEAGNGTAVSEADEAAENATAEVTDIPEADAEAEPEPEQAGVAAPAQNLGKRGSRKPVNPEDARIRLRVRAVVEELIADYSSEDRGIEIQQVAGGFRMATKPQHHDVVRAFARSLKPPVRLSIAALETLAVIAYKQPVTAPEISEIRGVEAAGVLGTLLERKLITTAGRKQVIGRPILYKTTKQFLMKFGLNELGELPSMEEFEKLAIDGQVELFAAAAPTTATAALAGDPALETPSAEQPSAADSEEPSPEETPDGAGAEPAAASSTGEQRSPVQTPEKTESDSASAESTENDKG